MAADYQKYEFLVNCNDQNESKVLISILESANIRTMTSYESSGAYLNIIHGYNFQGVNISVPVEDIELAKEILDEFKYDTKSTDEELEEGAQVFEQKKKSMASLIVWLMVVPFVAFMIFYALELL